MANYQLRFYLLLTALVTFLVPLVSPDVSMAEECPFTEKENHYSASSIFSSTCAYIEKDNPSIIVSEISRRSLPSILGYASDKERPTHARLTDLKAEFEKYPDLVSAMFIYDLTGKNLDQRACWLFGARKPRKPDWSLKLIPFSSKHCKKRTEQLTLDVTMEEDRRRNVVHNGDVRPLSLGWMEVAFLYANLKRSGNVFTNRPPVKNISGKTAWMMSLLGKNIIDVPGSEDFVLEVDYPYRYFTVDDEDTLSSIAQQVTGYGDDWVALWALNSDQLLNPDILQKGQKIRVPAKVDDFYSSNAEANAALTGTLLSHCIKDSNISCKKMLFTKVLTDTP